MKQFKTLLIALSFTFGIVTVTSAQSKIAHIDTQELIEAMPDYQSAMSQLDKIQKTYRSDVQDMMKEADTKSKLYQSEAESKTDEENMKRSKELQSAQQKIMKYQQNAQDKIQEKNEELMRPILEKARTAIQKVARAKGYDYVLNATTGGGAVLLADGYDLMDDVKKDLGIK